MAVFCLINISENSDLNINKLQKKMRLNLYTTLAVLACSIHAIKLTNEVDLGLDADVLPVVAGAGACGASSLLGVPVGGVKTAVPGHKHRHKVGGCGVSAALPGAGIAAGVPGVGLGGVGMKPISKPMEKTPEAAKNEASAIKAKAESAAKAEVVAKDKKQEAERAKAHAGQKQAHNVHEHKKSMEIKKKASAKVQKAKVQAKKVKGHGKLEAKVAK